MTDESQHVHRFEVKGSGLACYAECAEPDCQEKLSRGEGVVVGSRNKIRTAIAGE